MKRSALIIPALVIGLSAFISFLYANSASAEGKERTKLALTTGYLYQRISIDDVSVGAHQIGLHISLDQKGGQGSFHIDPNIQRYNQFGDETGNSEIADRSIEVTLTAVEREDPSKKGRRLYEIKGESLKGHLFLVVSAMSDQPRLLVTDNDAAVKYVFTLKEVGKDK